ncbi:hypothetical protein [Portibacter lacus]|uniref:Peptidase S74 domain-containing protein n=1 Tax=Portibacter lacus TaxID=1099794 RepID=A0AA37WEH9_9BACT|nr:hypothetical protein [Portibacter lacus]GLR18806.1 hypothetical protein GCM10007940_34220 [Portibacter lacus]
MKQVIILVFLLSFIALSAQNVGVNITVPESTMDIRSKTNAEPSELNISNQDRSRYVRFWSGSEMYPDPSMSWNPGHSLLFATYDDATFTFTEYMRIDSQGKMGIGIAEPMARLDVKGGDWNLDAGKPGDLRIGNATYNFRIGVATGGGGAGITRMYSQGNSLNLGTNNRPSLSIGANENIGIGTMDPQARLEINSSGLSDTLLWLKNGTTNGFVDYGIFFNDENATPTVGAYIKADDTAIFAESDQESTYVITGRANSTTGGGTGVYGESHAPNGVGVRAGSWHPSGTAVRAYVYAGQGNGIAVHAESDGSHGIGVQAEGNSIGVYGEGKTGVHGISDDPNGIAVVAYNTSNTGAATGISASSISPNGTAIEAIGGEIGVYGFASGANINGRGVKGRANGPSGQGVRGEAPGSSAKAIYGEATGEQGKGIHVKVTSTHSSANAILAESGGGSSYAGYFLGRVHVAGVLSKSSGSFKIDHPLDPENKYLSHSFVESPDMMNIYNGNIVTDKDGNAIVNLPDYFEALNMEFRYQLTVIGEFAQAIISEKISGNSFKLKTDKPNIEVSWQVTGVRNDAFARKNRIQVEEVKEAENRGKYLNPEAFDKEKAN